MVCSTRPPCPPSSPGVCPNSGPLHQWYHLAISFSDVLFSPQSFPASGSFPMNQLFTSGGQSIGALFSSSISLSNEYLVLISFRIGWFDLLAVQGTLKSLLQHHNSKASILQCSAFLIVQHLTSVHDSWKNHSFDYADICWQSDYLCFLKWCLGLP